MADEYFQYKCADVLSKALPRPLAYWWGVRLADRFFYNDRRGREAVMRNLEKVLRFNGVQPSEDRLRLMSRRTFQNFGKYVVDFFRYGRFTRRKVDRMVCLEHPERIESALGPGNGVLAVTAHYGSWEIGGAVLAAMGYPTNAVVLPENNKKTNRLFSARRERRGIKPIMLGNAARGVVSALRRNEFVAILADRDYTSHERQVDFFGTPAYLPLGPATLCIKAGAPILPAFLVRREDDSYLMRFAEPIFAGPRDTLDSIQASVCRTLEAEILKDPTQWYMFHEFWDYTGEGKQPARGEER